MKTHSTLKLQKLFALAFSSALLTGSASAAISISSTAPVVSGSDIGTTTILSTRNNNDDDELQVSPGQSFITSGADTSYSLTGFSFKTRSSNPSGVAFTATIQNGKRGSTVASESFTVPSGGSTNDWVTMTFATPIALAASTQYGVILTGGGFALKWQNMDESAVAGGWYKSTFNGENKDRLFVANLTAVPEPSSALLLGLGGLLLARRRR